MEQRIRMMKQQAHPCTHTPNPYTSHPVLFKLNISPKKQAGLTLFLFQFRLAEQFR